MDIVTAVATLLAALIIVGLAVVLYLDAPFRLPPSAEPAANRTSPTLTPPA